VISGHLLWWSVCAVLLFWAVGAYNRMVRLRSDALRAFTTLGQQLQRFTEHVVTVAPALVAVVQPTPTDAAVPISTGLPPWAGVHGAATQFAASLAVARIKPLDAEAMAALGAASAVLRMAWQRIADEDQAAPEPSLSATTLAQWDDIQRQAAQAAQEFGAAVGLYNAAVMQFPAALLAWLFGFRKAGALLLPSPGPRTDA